uniref:R-spondin 1 n=1 Tax=Scophthalmus maximus TaxID=52904 RepID=A0A8D2ZPN0_SCOMX
MDGCVKISTEGPPSCPKGCDRCSEYNGCIKCKPKLFIFLERNDIRQIGVCLASCPVGYFGMRNPEGNNRCTQCKIDNCEACFNRNFCTKCKEGLYSHSGRCYVSCPPGQRTANETMECVGQRASACELGEWSQWGSCTKKNKTCGFKKGSQSRARSPLVQVPALDTAPSFVPSQTCTPLTERRKCIVTKTPCARERKNKGDQQDDTNGRVRENTRGRGREGKDGSRGGGGGGGGGKRRKGQNRTTTAASVTTSFVT